MPQHRDIGALLQILREFLIGRKVSSALRFSDQLAPRDYPEPCYPPTPHEKLSKNHFYLRDARKEIKLPIVVGEAGLVQPKKLEDGSEKFSQKKWPPRPGPNCGWDDHQF